MARKATTRKDTRKAPKNNEFFNGLLTGLKEVAAHRSGEITLPSRYVDVPPSVDVKAIRTRLKLSQSEFADRFYFPIRTLQDWELGRNQPLSPIRAYLLVIANNPKMVERALRGPGAKQIAREVMPQSAA